MTEKEKFIRNKIEECTRIIEGSSYIGNKKAYAKERTQFKRVLNLIQKQQEEIEKLKSKNNDLLRKLRNRVKEIKKLTKYSAYKKEFSTLNKTIDKKDKTIDKKDKIIDLIIKEFYKKAHISTKCYLQRSIEECLKHKNCFNCLKQYFERKVEEK